MASEYVAIVMETFVVTAALVVFARVATSGRH